MAQQGNRGKVLTEDLNVTSAEYKTVPGSKWTSQGLSNADAGLGIPGFSAWGLNGGFYGSQA